MKVNGLFVHEYKVGNKSVKSLEEHPKNKTYWLRLAKGLTHGKQKVYVFTDKNGRFVSMDVRNKNSIDRYYPLRRN